MVPTVLPVVSDLVKSYPNGLCFQALATEDSIHVHDGGPAVVTLETLEQEKRLSGT